MDIPRSAAIDLPKAGEVRVWIAHVDVSTAVLERLEKNLSLAESQQAGKFRFERDRKRYVLAHGALREILCGYLGTGPRSIAFELNAFGKPFLRREASGDPQIRFNLSHSNELVAIGVVVGRHLGIDIEFIRPMDDIDSIGKAYFTEAERNILNTSGSDRKVETFFACWTRKEAYIKAVGKGLSIPLTSFDVSMIPGSFRRSLPASEDLPEVQRIGDSRGMCYGIRAKSRFTNV
jgi:4'-phosphopantetheinyl transferase